MTRTTFQKYAPRTANISIALGDKAHDLMAILGSSSSGNLNYNASEKITITVDDPSAVGGKDTVRLQVGINLTVIGSKDWPVSSPAEDAASREVEARMVAQSNNG